MNILVACNSQKFLFQMTIKLVVKINHKFITSRRICMKCKQLPNNFYLQSYDYYMNNY